ncbi:NYN domain-containing protein [Cellulomonas fengjieae]|uniref:NYN domain-containing protein n=1 Tax=Cellulomonas fengjieae TaxID=2819978 RepID=A0ABS3SGS5_9CELL|nr:NYN domain-containing protein [Cellulomonas fengjieae]MBO3084171.1 NYN domain-containing protein [Cellulomonas fengjieae]MBO3103609.1 NYN domain-containing protein [Cellulomonas fengjieae]QVI64582.1 NYN domain-containing protein [Cellulomonas fengjieae]
MNAAEVTGEDAGAVPTAVKAALVQLAADVLGAAEPTEVPPALRAVHRFAPRRRASAGAGPLWAALQDDAFRARVARVWAQTNPELAAGVAPDSPEPAAPSVGAATGAWLLGNPGWRDLLPVPVVDDGGQARARLERAQADAERLRSDAATAREEARSAQEELTALQRELRRLRSDADRARSEGRRVAEEARVALDAAQAAQSRAADELRQARDERRSAQAERTAARAEMRAARKLADTRVRLLLDTIVDAASGLRSELALPPVADLPADLVSPTVDRAVPRPGSRGRSVDDPELLDELLRQPWAHLVVDGYNVSKSGYSGLSLADQRRRLVDGLAALGARTGAEITCCFDGQDGPQQAPGGSARGVRVLFTAGEIADDLIRRLVHAEPPGRVLVVVTSDQEVVRDVEAAGAWVVPSSTLVARLQRL